MLAGLAQTHIVWENKPANLRKAEGVIKAFKIKKDELRDQEAGIVLFPEMTLTGFSMNTSYTAETDRQTVASFCKLAEAYGVAVGVGWVSAGGDLCENHYSIIDASGNEILDYVKLHPFAYSGEDRYFRGGSDIGVCRVGNMKIGTQICFDLRFPETFEILSDNAQLIVVPANWPERRREHWNTLLCARAIENQCYIAGVNCVGMMDGQYYSGDSCLYSPDGKPVCVCDKIDERGLSEAVSCADAGTEWEYVSHETVFIYKIENDVDDIRKAFPVKSARRPDLYRNLFLS